MPVRVPRLGSLLEPFWGPLRLSWRPLGRYWGPLASFWSPLGGLLGHLEAVLGASWPVLERREADKARMPKSIKNLREMHDFCPLGPSWECPWRHLGAFWKPLEPSGGFFGDLDRYFGDSGPSRTVLGASWGTLAASWGFSGPRNRPGGMRIWVATHPPGPPPRTTPQDNPPGPPSGSCPGSPPAGEGIKGKGLPLCL